MRSKYPKNDPLNYIPKIIKNSLYGRMGMNDNFTSSEIVDKKYYVNFEKNNLERIIDLIPLDESYLIEVKAIETATMINAARETHNINISIASAISSYARIFLSQLKNNPKLKLFYTDTDSIYTNLNPNQMNKLYPGIISSIDLGKLKLENISAKAIFLAPKCYYLQNIDGPEILKLKV